TRSFPDQRDLLVRLDGAHPHRRLPDIDELDAGKRFLEQALEVEVHMIKFDAEAAHALRLLLDGMKIVVPAPVGVAHVVGKRAAPRLPRIDGSRNDRRMVLIQDKAIATNEIAEQKPRAVAAG